MARQPRRKPVDRRIGARWKAYGGGTIALVIALAAIGMFWRTYGTWPDVLVDFGRELYVPWRLTEGQVLYRDIAYFNGPLSPYVNALWFSLFGVSLRTLAFVNLALVGVLLTLLYKLLAAVGSRTSACLACLFFVFVFGFSRITANGNYNYICPYSHELTHGLLLALGAIWFVGRFAKGAHWADAAACGLLVGLALLTKPEIFLAVLPATVIGIGLALWEHRAAEAHSALTAAVYGGAALVPPLAACALLSLAMPIGEAAAGTTGAHRWLFNQQITELPFYLHSMGVLDPAATGKTLAVMLFWFLLFLGVPAALGFLQWRTRTGEMIAAGLVFSAVGAGLIWNFDEIPAYDLMRPLPVVLLVALATLVSLYGQSSRPTEPGRFVLPITLLVFSILLLAKIFLYARVYHYGFSLAMPATLLLIVVLWDWAPRALERIGGQGRMLKGATLAVLLALVAVYTSLQQFDHATVRVGLGADAFWADARGAEVNRAIADVERYVPAEATLAGAPETIMINYLTRRVNPTPYITLMPVEMIMFGEETILASFREHPADFVLVSTERTDDYGSERFGAGYGEQLYAWMSTAYALVDGLKRPTPAKYYILLRKRVENAGGAPAAPSNSSGEPQPSPPAVK